jgi:hypothetical protein
MVIDDELKHAWNKCVMIRHGIFPDIQDSRNLDLESNPEATEYGAEILAMNS